MLDKKLIFFNTGIFFILIFFSEIFLKIINPPLIQIRIQTNRLARIVPGERIKKNNFDLEGFKFFPNSKSNILHQEYNYFANHDLFGWRSPCFQIGKNPDFFLLGDSFVYGTGVKDKNTFSCALSRKKINAYTMGIPGASPKQYIKIVEKNKDTIQNLDFKSKFNIYTMIFMGNDFEEFLSYSNINDLKNEDIESINHKGFILIPDATEISQQRLLRKSKLRNMPSMKIDVNYKFKTFISVCQKLNLNCLDAREVLNSESFYYIHDDHLNSQGVEKVAEFIKKNINI